MQCALIQDPWQVARVIYPNSLLHIGTQHVPYANCLAIFDTNVMFVILNSEDTITNLVSYLHLGYIEVTCTNKMWYMIRDT